MLTLDFEQISSKVHCELETKTVSNFPHFLSSPIVPTSEVFHDRQSTIMKDKKTVILILQYLPNPSSNLFETSQCV